MEKHALTRPDSIHIYHQVVSTKRERRLLLASPLHQPILIIASPSSTPGTFTRQKHDLRAPTCVKAALSLLLPLSLPSAFVFCVFCLLSWHLVTVRDVNLLLSFPSIPLTTRLRGQAKLPRKAWQQQAHTGLFFFYHHFPRSWTLSFVVSR